MIIKKEKKGKGYRLTFTCILCGKPKEAAASRFFKNKKGYKYCSHKCGNRVKFLKALVTRQIPGVRIQQVKSSHKKDRYDRAIWEFFNEKKIPKNYVIDHIDGDDFNCDILNLRIIPKDEKKLYYNLGYVDFSKKLNYDKARLIKHLLLDGMPSKSLSRIFGCSQTSISDIKTGRSWKYVTL